MPCLNQYIDCHKDAVRPPLMWFWGGKITDQEIKYQIGQFAASGIKEFFIHPGSNLDIDDYLSDEFFRLIRTAQETAALFGMHCSIYDDYNWPSGSNGGLTFKKHPWTQNKPMQILNKDLHVGATADIYIRGELVGAWIEFNDKMRRYIDITDEITVEKCGEHTRIQYKNTYNLTGSLTIAYTFAPTEPCVSGELASFSTSTPGTLDACNPDATDLFLREGPGKYYEHSADLFGNVIRRVFTDELSCAGFDFNRDTRPYTSILPEEFYKDHGYPLKDAIIGVASKRDTDEFVKMRFDYFSTMSRLFTENFMHRYADWCHDHGVALTGHLSGEGLVDHHTFMGNFYDAIRHFDIPGVDNILSKRYMDHPHFGFAEKMLASVAKFAGKQYTLCETYTGSGWDMTMEEAKRIAGLIVMRGVSIILYMGAFYSCATGSGKYFPNAYAPSHSWQNPLFSGYGVLSDYIQARGALCAETKPCSGALIMVPQYEHYVKYPEAGDINHAWLSAGVAAMNAGICLDVWYEQLIDDTRVADGRIICKGYQYDALIVPRCNYSSQKVLDMMMEFAQQGGKIVFVESVPFSAADTAKKYDFSFLFESEIPVSGCYRAVFNKNAAFFHLGPREIFDLNTFSADIKAFIGKQELPFCSCRVPKEIVTEQRTGDDFDLCFLMNTSDAETAAVIGLPDTGTVEVLSGIEDISAPQPYREEGKSYLECAIAPSELIAVVVHRDGAARSETAKTVPAADKRRTVILDGEWEFEPVGGNFLPLRVKFLQRNPVVNDELFEKAKYPNPDYACFEIPIETGTRYGDRWAACAVFHVEDLPDRLTVIAEMDHVDVVYINALPLKNLEHTHLWGTNDYTTDALPYIKKGLNSVLIVGKLPGWAMYHQLNSIVLRGNFSVQNDAIANPRTIIKPYSYNHQGYRYFSGTAVYRSRFTLSEGFTGVNLELDTADIAEVLINGISAGKILWRPYRFDITKLCKPGSNDIKLRLTSNNAAVMTLETVELLYQSVARYSQDVPVQNCGIRSAPVLSIK